jgi:glycosyltransferase involved in cell wall biosynthesis
VRIGWTSNAPWAPTGYSTQTNEIVPRIAADGHKIAIMANYGFAGSTMEWRPGIPVMGQGLDAYSNDITPAQIGNWISQTTEDGPGLGISLYDVWVYKSPQWDEIPMASWTPVDHSVVPEEVKAWFNRRGAGKWAIAMSRFGEHELLEAGVERERLFYAPHSIDLNIFKPTPSNIRADLNIPADAHLTMCPQANKGITPIRKAWPELLLAWAQFANRHQDAYIYLHTEYFGLANGVKLERLLRAVNAPMDRVRIVPQFAYRQGLDQTVLAKCYSASDVLLQPSKGEGFGIPTIESQACGTPVIVTNWTAMPELVGAGWKVGGQPEWDELQTGWWMTPNVEEILDALEQSYALKGDTEKAKAASEAGIAFASNYSTEKIYAENWRPILKTIEAQLPKAGGLNREQRRAAKRK